MYNRSVLLTCSAFALCVGLGMTSAWAMEREFMEREDDQPRFLPSRRIKLMAQINQALTSPDEGVAVLTALAYDENLDWEGRINVVLHLPDKGKVILTMWANDKGLDLRTRIDAALNLPDKGVAIITALANNNALDLNVRIRVSLNLPDKGKVLLTAWANDTNIDFIKLVTAVHTLPDEGVAILTMWANNEKLDLYRRRTAALNLPDKGKEVFTAWTNNDKLDWQIRVDAAVALPDQGEKIFRRWANDKDLDWSKRRTAARNLPDKGVAMLTAWANDISVSWEDRMNAAFNLPDQGEKIFEYWANDPVNHPQLRIESIKRMKNPGKQRNLYFQIFSNKGIPVEDRLSAWQKITIGTSFQNRQVESILSEILEKEKESKESVASFVKVVKTFKNINNQKELLEKMSKQKGLSIGDFLNAIKELSNEIQKELLENMLKQGGRNQKDKAAIQDALTQLNKSVVMPSSDNNNNNISTSTSTAKSQNPSKTSVIGKLLAASRMPATPPTAQAAPTAQASKPQDVISEGKQEVNHPDELEKKSKKKNKPSKQLGEKKSDAELKDLEEKERRIREDAQKDEKAKEAARKKRREEKKAARLKNDSDSDSDASSSSSYSANSQSDSESDQETEERSKIKQSKALIRQKAFGYMANVIRENEEPNALALLRMIRQGPVTDQLLKVAGNELERARRMVKRIFQPSNNNNNNTTMEKEEESFTVRPVKTFDIDSIKFHNPPAAINKYDEVMKAFKKTPLPTSDAKKLKDVTVTKNGVTVQCGLYSLRLSDADRLVYVVVEREIIPLFAGNHTAYDRYIAGANNITLVFDDKSKDEASESKREAME